MSHDPPVHIVGAGLAGSLMALYLARRGINVEVWERRPDLRRVDIPAGRSINLAISTRGLTALDKVGLKEAVLEQSLPMPGRILHDQAGNITFQAYGQKDQAIRSVSRRDLNALLMDKAEEAGVPFHFEQACAELEGSSGYITFESPTGARKREQGRLVIGADGAFSAVRDQVMKQSQLSYDQTWIESGYVELSIPPTADGDFAMDPAGLHIWPRQDYMLIALPNLDKSFTVTLFLPFKSENDWCFDRLKSTEDVRSFFNEQFADSVPLMPKLIEDFFENPHSGLATIKCSPYHFGERVVLIGDAAHAIVPFYGQGMNAAFESASLLDDLLANNSQAEALEKFTLQRQPNGFAIRQLALDHYYEMRASVASPMFLLQKKIEQAVERIFPGFIPLYGMVSFSNIPYQEAVERALRQTATLRTVLGLFALSTLVILGWWLR
ncbi:MAG: kynurenine 3-monooxygenase [Myxococcales bacterium]|nr:kynurenine 3-monooxygenase [Myxococcales bacterium]